MRQASRQGTYSVQGLLPPGPAGALRSPVWPHEKLEASRDGPRVDRTRLPEPSPDSLQYLQLRLLHFSILCASSRTQDVVPL
eukprot:5062480-Prymnesium_polylepis.1